MIDLKAENEILFNIYNNLLRENDSYRTTLKMPLIDASIKFGVDVQVINGSLLNEIRKIIVDNILCKELINNNT